MSTCPCPIVFFLLRAGAVVVPLFLLAVETTEVDPPLPSSFKMKESEPFSGRLVVAGGGATATAGEQPKKGDERGIGGAVGPLGWKARIVLPAAPAAARMCCVCCLACFRLRRAVCLADR
jgi:hypothetical protein